VVRAAAGTLATVAVRALAPGVTLDLCLEMPYDFAAGDVRIGHGLDNSSAAFRLACPLVNAAHSFFAGFDVSNGGVKPLADKRCEMRLTERAFQGHSVGVLCHDSIVIEFVCRVQ
jgi:hypothetical protein